MAGLAAKGGVDIYYPVREQLAASSIDPLIFVDVPLPLCLDSYE